MARGVSVAKPLVNTSLTCSRHALSTVSSALLLSVNSSADTHGFTTATDCCCWDAGPEARCDGDRSIASATAAASSVTLAILTLSHTTLKGKGSPYSITERRVPELILVLGSQPAGDVSHKPGDRLPLLSARPVVNLATLKRAATNFAAW